MANGEFGYGEGITEYVVEYIHQGKSQITTVLIGATGRNVTTISDIPKILAVSRYGDVTLAYRFVILRTYPFPDVT